MNKTYYITRSDEFDIKEMDSIDLNPDLEVKINTKYILLLNKYVEEIYIYDCETKSSIINNPIKFKGIKYFDFHSLFKEIFFVCEGSNVKIYEIDIKQKNIIELSLIKGHFSQIIFASFHPLNANILLTISDDKNINIYDITKSLPINHICLEENFIFNIKWGTFNVGFLSVGKTVINYFNYNNFYINEVNELKLNRLITDFHFFNDEILIVIDKGFIYLITIDLEIFFLI